MNVIMIAGTIGSDPDLRQMPTGKQVLNFKVVVDVGWGEKKHSLWIDCSMFGVRGEKLAPHLSKGKPVTVYGTFDLRTYTTQKGPGASITCDVADLKLQGGRPSRDDGEQPSGPKKPQMRPSAFEDDLDDPVPF